MWCKWKVAIMKLGLGKIAGIVAIMMVVVVGMVRS